MKPDGVYIYNISAKGNNPLQRKSCDLTFLCEDGKLKWLIMSKGIRLTFPLPKSNGESYRDIHDFLDNLPPSFDLDLNFDYKIKEYKSNYNVGEYYKYIYRPVISYKVQYFHFEENGWPFQDCYDDISIWLYREEYLSHIRQLELILDELKSVFKVIEPTKKNLKAYGNSLRNIIILSCSEIDSMMSKTLKENGFIPERGMYKTNHYFKLKKAMELEKYKLVFDEYESLGSFSPFRGWNEQKPTKSLYWYDCYNKIKHDRQANLHLANLKNALYAITAFAVLLVAQYGKDNDVWRNHMRRFFNFQNSPNWHVKDFYIPNTGKLFPIQYPFQ